MLALRFSALKMLPTDTLQVLPSAVTSSVCTANRGAPGSNLTYEHTDARTASERCGQAEQSATVVLRCGDVSATTCSCICTSLS